MCAALQLKVKIARQQALKEQKLRKRNLTKYIPNAAAAVFTVCPLEREQQPLATFY